MTKDDLLNGDCSLPWAFFLELCTVPRPSKHEEKIQSWLAAKAEERGWECRKDQVGNIVIAVPGCGDLAGCSPLVLQGHMDMVCEKNADIVHDFFNDPIDTHIDGEWLTSGKTTLGADNGVAMALGLALAASEAPNRLPLELLFTIDEETGLTGALRLEKKIVKGRHVLNLDSEDDKEFIIGCAGGLDMVVRFDTQPINAEGTALELSVSGLRGGHSGICIHEDRKNAILLLAEILNELANSSTLISLVALGGGNKRNAIPREASATILVNNIDTVYSVAEARLGRCKGFEPEAAFSVQQVAGDMDRALPLQCLKFLSNFPNGVIAMEPDIPGLVRTSCSLGVAQFDGQALDLIANTRSSAVIDKHEVADRVRHLAGTCGAKFETAGEYPGWEPSSGSRIVTRAADLYRDVFGHDPIIKGIHAGLEAGIIGDILDTQELLAFGPLIENAHSPEERLNIPSFERSYAFLKRIVSSPITAP